MQNQPQTMAVANFNTEVKSYFNYSKEDGQNIFNDILEQIHLCKQELDQIKYKPQTKQK